MIETLDFRHFGVIPDDLALMRRLVIVLSEDCPSPNKIVREANDLVEHYARRWEARVDIHHFFDTGALRQRIETALLKRPLFEKFAPKCELCSLVLKIFDEFEIYVSQYEKTRTFIKKQRSLASSKRNYFLAQAAVRDGGKFCKFCQSAENLKLDHIHPVVLGGLSILDNFQILCFQCNSRKGKAERAILHPRAFYSIPRSRREAFSYLQTAISYCESLAK